MVFLRNSCPGLRAFQVVVLAVVVVVVGVLPTGSDAARYRSDSTIAEAMLRNTDLENSQIFGSLTVSGLSLPTQYLYVRLVPYAGESFSTMVMNADFMVNCTVQFSSGSSMKMNGLAIGRGLYLFETRFRRPEYDPVIIHINTPKGEPIGASPIVLENGYSVMECDCPEPSIDDFSSRYQCPAKYAQLDADLENWPEKITKRMMESVPDYVSTDALVRYVIKDNVLYRKSYGSITDFKTFSDQFFQYLLRLTRLPDSDFYMNLGDWPLSFRDRRTLPGVRLHNAQFQNMSPEELKAAVPFLPVLSWCGSNETLDLVLPTYHLMLRTLGAQFQYTDDPHSIEARSLRIGGTWGTKRAKLFFRGRDSNKERIWLAQEVVKSRLAVKEARLAAKKDGGTGVTPIPRNLANAMDVGISNWFFHPKDESITREMVPFDEFFKYKYQLSIDGTVAAYRLPYLLGGNSLVFKQDSKYFEHFYRDLEPWKHFIPLNASLSSSIDDILSKIEWAQNNDKTAAPRIVANAQEYVRNNLSASSLMCYYAEAMKRYANRLDYTPSIEGMERVPRPIVPSMCDCSRNGPQPETKINEDL